MEVLRYYTPITWVRISRRSQRRKCGMYKSTRVLNSFTILEYTDSYNYGMPKPDNLPRAQLDFREVEEGGD